MVKPRLPEQIEKLFPNDVIRVINGYVPHLDKVPSPKTSPSLQRELTRIQTKHLAGKNAMYMSDLDDFVLDDQHSWYYNKKTSNNRNNYNERKPKP